MKTKRPAHRYNNQLDHHAGHHAFKRCKAALREEALFKQIERKRQKEEEQCAADSMQNGRDTGQRKPISQYLRKANIAELLHVFLSFDGLNHISEGEYRDARNAEILMLFAKRHVLLPDTSPGSCPLRVVKMELSGSVGKKLMFQLLCNADWLEPLRRVQVVFTGLVYYAYHI